MFQHIGLSKYYFVNLSVKTSTSHNIIPFALFWFIEKAADTYMGIHGVHSSQMPVFLMNLLSSQ